ncbi:MAG: hypothetical protein ACXW53_25960, partial [Candidatus Binatia bacterium]
NTTLGQSDEIGGTKPDRLGLTLEVRSYELGWILWSFGGRSDFQELTDRREFSEALSTTAPL